MFLNPQIEFLQLRGIDLAGSVSQQALSPLSFWKRNHITYIVRICQQHHEPIESERDTAVGRRSILKGFEEKSEPLLGLLFGYLQEIEHLGLDLRIVNTNRAASDLLTVDHQVIGLGADVGRIGIEFAHVFGHR